MLSKRTTIGLSAAVIVVLLLVVSITYRNSAPLSFPEFTAALTRSVKAGSARVPAKPSAATAKAAAVSALSLATYGFALSYPKSWQIQQDPQDGGAMNVYLSSEADTFFMTVTLATNTTGKSVKLNDLVNAMVASMPSSAQYKVVKRENGTTAGSPTKVLTVTQKADNGLLLQGQHVFLLKGKTLCVFYFANIPEKYDQSLRLFNTTLKTVTLR